MTDQILNEIQFVADEKILSIKKFDRNSKTNLSRNEHSFNKITYFNKFHSFNYFHNANNRYFSDHNPRPN